MREILSLHIGNAGIETGKSMWDLYCLEHHLDIHTGKVINPEVNFKDSMRSVFHEASENQFSPRNLFIDLEPDALYSIQRSPHKNLFAKDSFFMNKGDAGCYYERARYGFNCERDEILNLIRKHAERCSSL